MASIDLILITCEHGGNRVPSRYKPLFHRRRSLLSSHRGWDPGSLPLARTLSRHLGAPLVASTTTRLLVDLNRSPGHPRLFSEITRDLPAEERRWIMEHYYVPYRSAVEARIAEVLDSGHRVWHISTHSFTHILGDEERLADVGLLYDSSRQRERDLCLAWQSALESLEPRLQVRRNYPYRGAADGFTTYLRRRFPEDRYAGIELEVNQRRALLGGRRWALLRRHLADSLADSLHLRWHAHREAEWRRRDQRPAPEQETP